MALTGTQLLRSERGLMRRIALEIGIAPSAVIMWKEIPAERVPAVSRISGIPRHLLRPDLWEAPACACTEAA